MNTTQKRTRRSQIDFKDMHGVDIRCGDTVRTYDKTGNKWVGCIQRVDSQTIVNCSLKTGVLYEFMSNYGTWITDQSYASTLEIV